MRILSYLLDTGRAKSHTNRRPLDFYLKSVERLRERLAPFSFTVYGNVPEACEAPLRYTDLIGLLGTDRFNRVEEIRCRVGCDGWQGESSWYHVLTLSKLLFLKKTLEDDPSLPFIYWIDSGVLSHSFLDGEMLKDWSPRVGFHMIRRNHGGGWHGIGMWKLMDFPGRHVWGSVFGGDRENVLRVARLYLKTLDEALDKGIMPLEEDILTLMYERDPKVFTVHEGFENFIYS